MKAPVKKYNQWLGELITQQAVALIKKGKNLIVQRLFAQLQKAEV
jgi:hypothetical protein